ncbi:MAG: DUF6265 family protein [Bacteroidota bacterium]
MKIIQLVLLFGLAIGHAQGTLQMAVGQTSPEADLMEVSWLVGHWQGEGLGGTVEEIWSPPIGGSMMFVFRLISGDKVVFYEIGHIKQTGPTLLMQLKHFNSDLKGWEAKEDTVDFKLVRVEKNRIFFEGLTITKISDDQIQFQVLIEDGDEPKEAVFNYRRVNQL